MVNTKCFIISPPFINGKKCCEFRESEPSEAILLNKDRRSMILDVKVFNLISTGSRITRGFRNRSGNEFSVIL
jgi:hypothetical protein